MKDFRCPREEYKEIRCPKCGSGGRTSNLVGFSAFTKEQGYVPVVDSNRAWCSTCNYSGFAYEWEPTGVARHEAQKAYLATSTPMPFDEVIKRGLIKTGPPLLTTFRPKSFVYGRFWKNARLKRALQFTTLVGECRDLQSSKSWTVGEDEIQATGISICVLCSKGILAGDLKWAMTYPSPIVHDHQEGPATMTLFAHDKCVEAAYEAEPEQDSD